jgi:1-acyl-sn-glycerol-3-phosphate acyltransferase
MPFDPQRVLRLARTPWGRFLAELPARYFSATLEGAEHIPRSGGALLVGNHAMLGLDAFVLHAVVLRDVGRYVRFLGEKNLWRIPGLGPLLDRVGSVAGEPEAAVAMLEAGDLVGVYPGGVDDSFKTAAERYQLQWGARNGFAKVAIRANVPIVPVAGLGIDEMYDVLAREPWLGRRLFGGARYDLPVALGAFGTPVPHRVPIRFVALPPVRTADGDVERVRAATHDALDAALRAYALTCTAGSDSSEPAGPVR